MAMIAPELNTPRHPWYQRHYHVKIPRQAESRQYLDGAFLSGVPPVAAPIGWDFGMRVGLHSSGNVGYRDPAHGPGHGGFNPTTLLGYPVSGVLSVNTGSCFVWLGASVQIPGISTITVTVQGFATPMVCPWSNATPGTVSARYQLAGGITVAFGDHLLANVGKVLGVTLVGSALLRFSPPYPWEAFTTQTQVNDFVEEQDLDVPPGWFAMTLVAKKAYLKATYGEPAP